MSSYKVASMTDHNPSLVALICMYELGEKERKGHTDLLNTCNIGYTFILVCGLKKSWKPEVIKICISQKQFGDRAALWGNFNKMMNWKK